MSKEGAAKQDKISEDVAKTGVQEYIDKLNSKLDLINQMGVVELKSGIEKHHSLD